MVTKSPVVPTVTPVRQPDQDGGAVVLERRTQKTQPPQMHQVVLLNDDYTPMEFEVTIIQDFFAKDLAAATRIMLKIHLEGKGVCGIYPRDIAATKVYRVMDAASQAGHPLQCVCEPAGT